LIGLRRFSRRGMTESDARGQPIGLRKIGGFARILSQKSGYPSQI